VYPCLMMALLTGVAGRTARILPPPEANTEPDVVLEAGYPGNSIPHLDIVSRAVEIGLNTGQHCTEGTTSVPECHVNGV
jgi:hypothetical protein